MPNGSIKRLVRDRGFGFIRDDNGLEWFFHRTAVTDGTFDQLNEGQRVTFEEEPSAKGPRGPASFLQPRSACCSATARVLHFDPPWLSIPSSDNPVVVPVWWICAKIHQISMVVRDAGGLSSSCRICRDATAHNRPDRHGCRGRTTG